jgi:hypothetical protein
MVEIFVMWIIFIMVAQSDLAFVNSRINKYKSEIEDEKRSKRNRIKLQDLEKQRLREELDKLKKEKQTMRF